MRIRQIRMTLPARFKDSAIVDARQIAEAAARAAYSTPAASASISVELPGNRDDAHGLATAAATGVASTSRGR